MLKLARKLASRSQHAWALHASIVTKGGAIVSTGYNHDEIHAEISALQDLWPDKRRGTRLWSIRVTKTGKLANAKPCARCEKEIRKAGVKSVFYSTDEGTIKKWKIRNAG